MTRSTDITRQPVTKFWLFIVLGLVTTLAFGVTAIWRSSQQPLDNVKADFIYMQNRLIENSIGSHFSQITEGLSYFAQRPVVISAILGESRDNIGVRTALEEFDLLRSLTHIEVIDVLGDRIGMFTPDPRWHGVFSGSEILSLADDQLDSIEPLVNSRYRFDQNFLLVSVPVIHRGLVEGALVANFHIDLIDREFSEIGLRSAILSDASGDTESILPMENVVSRRLDEIGLTLNTSWDYTKLNNDRAALVWSLSGSLFVAVAVAFLALGFVGQSLIVRPQKMLVQSQQELLKSEQRASELAEVAESANDGVVITDNTGKVLWVNRSMVELTGYSADELIGCKPGDILQGPESCPETRKSLHDAVESASPIRTEILNYTKDQKPYWVEIALTPVFDGDYKVVRFIAIERDVTAHIERLELEKELQSARKLEAVGQLAAGIAHEINTPCQFVGDNLNFFHEALEEILPFVEWMRKACDESGASELADRDLDVLRASWESADIGFFVEELPASLSQAKDGMVRISEIVRAMKDLSHPGTDKLSTDLNRVIESCLTVTRSEWKYVANLEMSLFDELPAVFVSPGEINQVCVNILVNAAHAISERYEGETSLRGCIEVTTKATPSAVTIEISDNGCGMPDHVKARIFDPFFTTKEVGKGTGQGLAIAYDIITKRHNGSLKVDSEDGVGTVFKIELPIEQVDEFEQPEQRAA